jgi:hypothetical protein
MVCGIVSGTQLRQLCKTFFLGNLFFFSVRICIEKEKGSAFKVRYETPLRIKERRNYFLKQILQFLWFLPFPLLEPFTGSSGVLIFYKHVSPNHKETLLLFSIPRLKPRELSFLPTLHWGRRVPQRPQTNGVVR